VRWRSRAAPPGRSFSTGSSRTTARHDLHRAAARYASVYGLGFVVYSVALAVGVEVLHLAAFTANVGAIAVAGTVNFAGSELFALGE